MDGAGREREREPWNDGWRRFCCSHVYKPPEYVCVCVSIHLIIWTTSFVIVWMWARRADRRVAVSPRRRRPASPPPKSTGTAPFLPTWVTQSPETDRRKWANRIKRQLLCDGWVVADELFIYSRVDCETLFFAKITRAGISLIGEACQVFISSHRPSSHRSIPLQQLMMVSSGAQATPGELRSSLPRAHMDDDYY
jgi:hypothetical protein